MSATVQTANATLRRPWASRAQVEALLEALLGRPRRSARDIHAELVVVDRQRQLLSQVYSRKSDTLFAIDEVELVIDAIEEHASCSVNDLLEEEFGPLSDFSPPPLEAREVRQLIAVVAERLDRTARDLLFEVSKGLAAEQTRLRADLLTAEEARPRPRVRTRRCPPGARG